MIRELEEIRREPGNRTVEDVIVDTVVHLFEAYKLQVGISSEILTRLKKLAADLGDS